MTKELKEQTANVSEFRMVKIPTDLAVGLMKRFFPNLNRTITIVDNESFLLSFENIVGIQVLVDQPDPNISLSVLIALAKLSNGRIASSMETITVRTLPLSPELQLRRVEIDHDDVLIKEEATEMFLGAMDEIKSAYDQVIIEENAIAEADTSAKETVRCLGGEIFSSLEDCLAYIRNSQRR